MLKQESKLFTNKIGLVSAVIICMNSMIGGGIFALPSKLAASVGPAAILSYCFAAFAVFFMAINIARVASLYPGVNSFHAYTKEWGGHNIGLFAHICYIVGIIASLSALTQIAALQIHTYLNIPFNIAGIGLILIILTINLVGIKYVKAGQTLLIMCTVFSLISITIICFFNGQVSNLSPFMPFGIVPIANSVKIALFSFLGFETITSLYNLVENPKKTMPLAILISVMLVAIIYIAFITSIMLAIPKNILADSSIPLAKAIAITLPKYAWLSKIIAVSILTSIIGVIQAISYATCQLSNNLEKLISNKPKLSFFHINFILACILIFNFLIIKNLDILFCFATLFIVTTLILSTFTLIIKKKNNNLLQKISTFIGIFTGLVILISSVYDLIKIFMKG